jgi:hypothetical protein
MMTEKPVRKAVTRYDASTKQRDAARRNRLEVIEERTLLLALLATKLPAHIAPLRVKPSATDQFKWALCLHSADDKTRVTWKISHLDRMTTFERLPLRADDADPDQTKDSRIEALERLVGLSAEVRKDRAVDRAKRRSEESRRW